MMEKDKTLTSSRLTPKQEKFCQGLISGLSQRKAYIEAYDSEGMSSNTIDRKACLLNATPKIRARMDELYAETASEAKWSLQRLISNFESLHEKCTEEVPVLDRRGKPTGATTFRDQGAIKALENIGKLLGYYKEKVEHSGTISNPYAGLTEKELRKLASE